MNLKAACALSTVGALIGGAIGGYLSAVKTNYIYAGLGGGLGAGVGWVLGIFIQKKENVANIVHFNKKLYLLLCGTSFLLSAIGTIAFFLEYDVELLLGGIFFAATGIYFKKNGYISSGKK